MPWTNKGLLNKVKAALGVIARPNYTLRLFVNDTAITEDTDVTELLECSRFGYDSLPLFPTLWNIAVAASLCTATYALTQFEFGASPAPQTVYGFFVTDNNTGIVCWGDRFTDPFVIPPLGGTLNVEVVYYDQGE